MSLRVLGWLLKALLGLAVLSLLWVGLYAVVSPPATATMLGDANGATRFWRPLDAIDSNAARAAIAAEDAKFCAHGGFDADAIEDAWSRYRKGGRIRGGSTISQQTAKNVFLWQGGGFLRKGLEAWFTLLIEQIWGKRRIMEVYLNVAETGIGTYGVEAGARRYFRHGADRLTPTEAARIAAVLPLPKARGAVAPTGFTRRYGNSILARMRVVGRDGVDECLGLAAAKDAPEPARKARSTRRRDPAAALDAVVPPPDLVPAERLEPSPKVEEAPAKPEPDEAPATDPKAVAENPL